MKIQAIALAVTTSLCAFGSHAAGLTGRTYVVGSIGTATIDLSDAEEYYEGEADFLEYYYDVSASADVEDNDTSFSVGVGHWFSDNVAIEAFYRDYGTVSAGLNASDGVDSMVEKDEFSASGLGVGILGLAPVSDAFSLYARVDLVNLETETSYHFSDTFGNYASGKNDDTNMKFGLGVGAQYVFDGGFAIRGDFQRIEAELEEFKEDIDSFNFSLLVMF